MRSFWYRFLQPDRLSAIALGIAAPLDMGAALHLRRVALLHYLASLRPETLIDDWSALASDGAEAFRKAELMRPAETASDQTTTSG